MIKLYCIQTESGDILTCNWPIESNGQLSIPYDCLETDLELVNAGTHKFKLENNILVAIEDLDKKKRIEDQTKSIEDIAAAKKYRKIELIGKVTGGTATPAEQEEFANLL